METTGHTYVLKIEGIKGECELPGYEGGVLLDSFNMDFMFPVNLSNISTGNPTDGRGKVTQAPVNLSQKMNLGGVSMLQKVWTGKVIDKIEIICINNNFSYLTIEFSNAIFRNISTSGEGEVPKVRSSFLFDKVNYLFKPPSKLPNLASGQAEVSYSFESGAMQ